MSDKTRVWISPEGDAIRYQFPTEDMHEVNSWGRGESWVDGLPTEGPAWTELTS